MKLILVKNKKSFSYLRYFLFTYFKNYSVYDKFIEDDIFYIPFKKRLSDAYLNALKTYLKTKNMQLFLSFDEEIKKEFKKVFSTINIINIYNTIFLDVLKFFTKNNLYEYEIIFVSDNIKEIKDLIDKCIKNVKSVSVLTEKPYLYESMKDYVFLKYGVLLNVKSKKEKLKKHNKIYVNCGYIRVFDKNLFKNVNMIDVFDVYEGVINSIILEANQKEKEYARKLDCPYSLALAEFLYGEEKEKKYKIVNIKK